MIFVDLLIPLVQKHPAIWNRNSVEYKERIEREKAWLIVAEEYFEDWSNKSRETQALLVTELKNKWRHVRDNYTRFIQLLKKDGPTDKRRKYIHADALDFIRSSIDETCSSTTFDDEEYSSGEDRLKIEVCDSPAYESSNEQDPYSPPPPPPPPPLESSTPKTANTRTRASYKPYTRTKKKSTTKPETQKAPVPTLQEQDDPHRYYLLSLLPYYRKLSEGRQLEFQQMVTKFFMKKRK